MERIEKNHWFVNENKLLISFMNFHVTIEQVLKDEIIFWRTIITNREMENMIINFATLEDCIYFSENYISNSWDFDEIKEKKKIYKKEQKVHGKQKVKRINRINDYKN